MHKYNKICFYTTKSASIQFNLFSTILDYLVCYFTKICFIECTTKSDWKCVFPFIENENDTEPINKCAWFEDEHTFRCATEVDEYNVWTKYGDCMYKCPLEGNI